MAKKIFKLIFLLVACISFSSWIISQTEWGQKKVRDFAKRSFEKALGTTTKIGSVHLFFPLFVKIHDLEFKNGDTTLTIDSLSCIPLWLDLPLNRLTLLSLSARGCELKGDHPEKLLNLTDDTSLSLSILSYKIRSLHVAHSKLPGSQFDGSMKGKFFYFPSSDTLTLHTTLTRSTPTVWPKKLKIRLKKEKSDYKCSGTLLLNGASSPLIGEKDMFEWDLQAKKEGSFFERAQGTWTVRCPTNELPLANNFVVNRMLHANGTLSYEAEKVFSLTCDDLSCSMVFGKAVRVQTDVEGSGTTLLQYGAPLTFHAKMTLESASRGIKGREFRVVAPSFTCNSFSGTLEGMVHHYSDDTSFTLFSSAEGTLFSGTKSSPIQFSGNLTLGDTSSFSTNLVIEPFQLSAKVEHTLSSDSSWASFTCQDLSAVQEYLPLPLAGAGEISFSSKKSDTEHVMDLASHFSNATLGPVSCKNADITLSSQNFLEKISASIDLSSAKFSDLFLDKAKIGFSFNPKTWLLDLPDLHVTGKASALPFDLSGSGEGKVDASQCLITLNTLDGSLLHEKVTLEQPAEVKFYDFEELLSQVLFSIKLGGKGSLHGQWIHPTPSRCTLELGWNDLPFPIMASLVGIESSSGSVSGKCHYQTTPRTIQGAFQMQANVTRCGPLGNPEGSLDIETTLSLTNTHMNGSTSINGSGVIEPILCTFSLPIQQRPKTPLFQFLKDAPLKATLQGKASVSKLLYYWMPEEIGCEALLSLKTALTGSLNDIHADGPVALTEGRMELLATGQVLEEIEMEGSLNHRHLTVHSIKGSDTKGGSLSGVGSIDFSDPFTWQTSLTCSNLEVVNLPYTNATADGTLHLKGTAHDLIISGTATAKRAFLDVAARFPKNIPELQVTFCGEPQSEKPPFTVFFDLRLHGSSDCKIQGRGLTTEWKGYAHLIGPASKLRIEGLLDCTKGSFTLAGKELSISRGMIHAGGDLFRDSRLNVLANVSLSSISVQVGLRGSLKEPKFFIQSTPSLPEKEILSLLLFNKEFGDISPVESLQLANAALTLEQTSGPFELIDRIKTTFGIDLIDIGASPLAPRQPPPWTTIGADSEESEGPLQAPQNDVTLKVGKYISSGVAVTVSKDISAGTNRIGLEAALSQHVSAQAEIGDDAGGIASLKWKKDY